MPITTEDEPEDIDDDAPSRVRLQVSDIREIHLTSPSLLFALSTGSLLTCPQAKSSLL